MRQHWQLVSKCRRPAAPIAAGHPQFVSPNLALSSNAAAAAASAIVRRSAGRPLTCLGLGGWNGRL